MAQSECPSSPPLPQTTLSQPRFSVFGKKVRFNVVSPMTDTTTSTTTTSNKPTISPISTLKANMPAEEPSPTKNTHTQQEQRQQQQEQQPRRLIKKFELHSQAKSTNVLAANQQEKKERERLLKEAKEQKLKEEQERLTNPDYYHDKLLKATAAKKKKKSVHFDPFFLERVCLFTEEQEPIQLQKVQKVKPKLRLVCPFWSSKPNAIMVVNKKWFSVENFAIKGRILVRNLALDKLVSVRYTFDTWKTVNDVEGLFFGPYLKNPAFDVYEFVMDLGVGHLYDAGEMRAKMELSIQLTADGTDYWDNNNELNYHIRIISDPLNDPHYLRKKENQDANLLNTVASDDSDDDEETYYRDNDTSDEKHSSFTDALKGYQHAKPAHLRKRQPWLGTRYDFSHSLSLAKGEHSDEDVEEDDDFFIKPTTTPDLLLTPSSSSDLKNNQNLKPIFINHSAPPSPVLSPTLDVDSTYYLNLLNKYCFYNGDTESQQNSNSPVKS